MKITKQNYNELRTQELDNNFAKVWHVNELATETANSIPYKSYVVNMYWDSVTLTPSIYEIYNNTGDTITWHDTSGSNFTITGFTGITANNIFITANFWGDDSASPRLYYYYIQSGNLIISVTDSTGNVVSIIGDGATIKSYIEIRIYN